eukprot:5326293-Lingulodinium_polyedra.AAC.1
MLFCERQPLHLSVLSHFASEAVAVGPARAPRATSHGAQGQPRQGQWQQSRWPRRARGDAQERDQQDVGLLELPQHEARTRGLQARTAGVRAAAERQKARIPEQVQAQQEGLGLGEELDGDRERVGAAPAPAAGGVVPAQRDPGDEWLRGARLQQGGRPVLVGGPLAAGRDGARVREAGGEASEQRASPQVLLHQGQGQSAHGGRAQQHRAEG